MDFFGYKLTFNDPCNEWDLLYNIKPKDIESFLQSQLEKLECFVIGKDIYIGLRVMLWRSIQDINFQIWKELENDGCIFKAEFEYLNCTPKIHKNTPIPGIKIN